MKEGDLIKINDVTFEVVLDTIYSSKRILLLHDTEAPYGIMFVCVYYTDEVIIPIENNIIKHRIISMYERREGINSDELLKDYIYECDNKLEE